MIQSSNKFLEWADIDCEAARILFKYSINCDSKYSDIDYQASFFCAQAVEKYLKGYLFYKRRKDNPKLNNEHILKKFKNLSHDLEKIHSSCVKEDSDFKNCKSIIDILKDYSLLKYPDIAENLMFRDQGLSISSGNVAKAKQIGEFIKRKLN